MKRTLLLICTLLCANVLMAQTRFWVDSLQYEVTSTNPAKVEVYSSNQSIVIADIPATVTYEETTYSVTSIGRYAFDECSSLTSVNIGKRIVAAANKSITVVITVAKVCLSFILLCWKIQYLIALGIIITNGNKGPHKQFCNPCPASCANSCSE